MTQTLRRIDLALIVIAAILIIVQAFVIGALMDHGNRIASNNESASTALATLDERVEHLNNTTMTLFTLQQNFNNLTLTRLNALEFSGR